MQIILPGIPESQTRMKFSSRGAFVKCYDPKEKEKKRIREMLLKEFDDTKKFEHPEVSFLFYMPIPKSLPKKTLLAYALGKSPHEKKPDVDNLVKLYLDCMDGICFEGDQKVSLGGCIKIYHQDPRTVIFITERQSFQECGRSTSFERACLPCFCGQAPLEP